MEYDPSKNIALRHSNDKLVFFMSSDPDKVIGNIASFAESNETSLQVLKLSEMITNQTVGKTC